jgi:hypothetical protein
LERENSDQPTVAKNNDIVDTFDAKKIFCCEEVKVHQSIVAPHSSISCCRNTFYSKDNKE